MSKNTNLRQRVQDGGELEISERKVHGCNRGGDAEVTDQVRVVEEHGIHREVCLKHRAQRTVEAIFEGIQEKGMMT
jgi:hypothetical protein